MKMTFKKERDRDLLRAYYEVLKSYGEQAPYVSRREVVKRAVASRAERFYVTFEEAQRNLRLLKQRKSLRCQNENKKAMYRDLYNQVLEHIQANPKMTFNSALLEILSTKDSPRFYMNENTALLIIYSMQKK